MASRTLSPDRQRILIVLFIPSVERDGVTPIDQDRWVRGSLELFGRVFGGATAYPRGRGVWRDDEDGGRLVFDEPVAVHCYTLPKLAQDRSCLLEIRKFCAQLLRDGRQGEVALIIDGGLWKFRQEQEGS